MNSISHIVDSYYNGQKKQMVEQIDEYGLELFLQAIVGDGSMGGGLGGCIGAARKERRGFRRSSALGVPKALRRPGIVDPAVRQNHAGGFYQVDRAHHDAVECFDRLIE